MEKMNNAFPRNGGTRRMSAVYSAVLILISIGLNTVTSAHASELRIPRVESPDSNRVVPNAAAMTVTKPKSGEKWRTGKTYSIRWVKGSLGGKVRVYLYRSGKYYKTLGDTANDGSVRWKVPSNISTSSRYQIAVQSWVNDSIYDFSPYFTITKSSSGGGGYKICKTGSKKHKWSSKKMRYYVNTKGGPSGALGAIKRGASVWNRVKGSSFKFIYRGKTRSRAHGKYDGQNIVTFGVLSKGTVGVNVRWVYSSGQIIDSDIRFNTLHKWSTKKAKNAYDVQGVAAHEFGHSLALCHITGKKYKDHTMYPSGTYASSIKMRTLESGDKRGIQALY